ncbi:M67 family metallopeptidase [Synechococcus sp. M16CYN]|uniref:M67 family metallopeptidase n=1 Tax=Synechococcus sp. M16CYN TaxID=3103139 RepID=UPI00324DEB55
MGKVEVLTQSAERIGERPFVPSLLRFDHQCLTILQRSSLVVNPYEGCGLLLGTGCWTPLLTLVTVWPCCNVWGMSEFSVNGSGRGSRLSRFSLDPREQIAAQRWARSRDLQVLGVYHSHPRTPAKPSNWDRCLAEPERLMLILSGIEGLRAWWMGSDRKPLEILIEVCENHHTYAAEPTLLDAESVRE